MDIAVFTFNDFAENTYLLYDESGECLIIDPGCNQETEQNQLLQFIQAQKLNPVRLVNTHCHIDHVLGNAFIAQKFGLKLHAHQGEIPVLEACQTVASMYHIPYQPSPPIEKFIDESTQITFGNTVLQVLFTPGHSPASISLYHADSNILVAGDVLFQGSIGRTDLPGGNFDTLARSIKTKLYVLPDVTMVYPGHGPATTIGIEKKSNPFVRSNG